MSDEQGTLFFDADQGIGLSYLRLRITPQGTTDELVTAQKAAALGVKVWAAPWSPPGEWKIKNTGPMGAYGGTLVREHWQDWADRLAAFAKSMGGGGCSARGPLGAERAGLRGQSGRPACGHPPTSSPSCATISDPTLAREGLTLPIVAPETQNWELFGDFANPLLADPAAAAYIGPLATHAYGNASAHTLPAAAGHPVWLSEISAVRSEADPDPGMGSGLWTAQKIHDSLVNGGVSVFHWWWLNPGGPAATAASDHRRPARPPRLGARQLEPVRSPRLLPGPGHGAAPAGGQRQRLRGFRDGAGRRRGHQHDRHAARRRRS